jgi:hypothetical protein
MPSRRDRAADFFDLCGTGGTSAFAPGFRLRSELRRDKSARQVGRFCVEHRRSLRDTLKREHRTVDHPRRGLRRLTDLRCQTARVRVRTHFARWRISAGKLESLFGTPAFAQLQDHSDMALNVNFPSGSQ